MKPIAIIAIIAAVVVVGGACAGVAFSGVLNGGTTGPGGDDPVVPTDPVDPTPTETPTETPTPTPTDSSMSYFSPMTSSGSSSGSSSSSNTGGSGDDETEEECNHVIGDKWGSNNDGSHSKTCELCGEKVVTEDCSEYDNYQYKGDHTHNMFCVDCGYEASGLCEAGSTTHSDEDEEYYHSVKCKYCEAYFEGTEACFNGGEPAADGCWTPIAGTNTHTRTCDGCNYQYIADCTSTEKCEHVENTETHTFKGECKQCGRTATEGDSAVPCVLTYTPVSGEGHTHTVKCTLCDGDYGTKNCEYFTYKMNTANPGTHTTTCANCSAIVDAAEDCTFKPEDTVYYLEGDNPTKVETCANCGYMTSTDVVAAIDGVGYVTLADALEAVQEGETIEILRTGEYAPFTITKNGVTVKGINTGNAATSTVIKNTVTENLKAYADGITLDSLYIDSTTPQTISWMNSGAIDPYIDPDYHGIVAQDLTVKNCYMEGHGNGDMAIMDCANDLTFTGNTVKNFENGVQVMHDNGAPDEFVITGNTFINVEYAIGSEFYFGQSPSETQNGVVIITGNTVEGGTIISVWDYAQTKSSSSAFKDMKITGNSGDITYLLKHFNYKETTGLTLTPGTGTQEVRNLSRVAFDVPPADSIHYTINKTNGSALDKIDGDSSLAKDSISVNGEEKAYVYTIASGEYLLVNTTSKVKYAFTVNDPVVGEQQYVELNTIVIADAEDMVNFAAMVNAGETCAGKTVKLMADIDLTGKEWTALKEFAGTFDGQGYTISNLNGASLFGTVSGEVKNLNLDGATRSFSAYTNAGTASFIGTVAENAVVDNCKVSDVTLTWTDTVTDCGDGISGVIGGVNAGATVQNCEFNNIEISAYGKLKRIGGIFSGISGTVKNCTVNDVSIITLGNNGYTRQAGGFVGTVNVGAVISGCTINDVTVTTEYAALKTGGFAGLSYGGTITDCDMNNVIMSVAKTYSEFGGFIGQHDSRSDTARITVTNCHITGLDMTVKVYYQDWSCSAAGFISGVSGGADITNCSVAGAITANEATVTVGGFVGSAGSSQNYTVNITDCVADVDITVGDNNGGAFAGRVGGCHGTGDTWNVTMNFNNCEANGTVTATGTGVAGEFYGEKVVSTCSFTGCKVNGVAFNG